jgi:hypothetical protein
LKGSVTPQLPNYKITHLLNQGFESCAIADQSRKLDVTPAIGGHCCATW